MYIRIAVPGELIFFLLAIVSLIQTLRPIHSILFSLFLHCFSKSVVHGAMGCGQKRLSVSVAMSPAPVRVPSQRPLPPSVASSTSVVNDKGDNEMILRAVHRSPGICLTAEENPLKPQLGDRTVFVNQYTSSKTIRR